ICVTHADGFEVLTIGEIMRLEASLNYTNIFLIDKQKILVAKTLKEFENMLSEYDFFRVHNSHLVNLHYVSNYNKGKGSSYITLSDGTSIEVSVRRKEEFIEKIKGL
ncbi:MAG: LytTR family DNA-binding domain-containing protein, partial [Bacteroidota bacterium]